MRTHETVSYWRSLAWPAALEIAGLSVVGAASCLCFFSPDNATGRIVLLVLVLTLPKLIGLMWYLSRPADGRQRAALASFAEQEEATSIHSKGQ